MSLFQLGRFKLHSGRTSNWIIDCTTLTDDDWAWAAAYVSNRVVFRAVEGIPKGGLKFAEALKPYTSNRGVLLIVDDVLSTGTSMEEQRAGRIARGFVLFDRRDRYTQGLTWVRSIWHMGTRDA